MAHAYTPGLRVSAKATVRKERRLTLKGTVMRAVGDVVRRDDVVARTELPGNVTTINIVNRLGITPGELQRHMLVQEGDLVQPQQPIAETRPLIKWFKTTVTSEIAGTVESISSITGQVMLREPPSPLEVRAYVDGTVTDVIEDEGVVIETSGAFIQGIFGVGGECWGPLKPMTDNPQTSLAAEDIGDDCRGMILVGGGLIDMPVIERAREVGAIGLVGGGIRDYVLRDLLGYDLGVAITGAEQVGLTLIVTEGFGEIAMAARTFDILHSCSGREASISGATQIRAGVLRPEIIVPKSGDSLAPGDQGETDESSEGMKAGDPLRVIRAPHFGRIGRVSDLIPELRRVESGAFVRVLEVAFDDSERAVVPRANVELIEE